MDSQAETGSSYLPKLIPAVQTSIRASLSAAIATYIAYHLQLPYPIYAMISAVIVTDLSGKGTRKLAAPRLAGTVLGATLGAAFSDFLPQAVWAMGLGIFAAMLLSFAMHLHQAAKLSGYVCGIVMMSFGDHPWMYAFHRLVETALGIAVAVAVSFIPKLLNSDVEST